VRSLFSAWERGDVSSSDWADPDIEFVMADGPEPASWRGRAGMAEGFRNIITAWDGWRAEAEAYRELDDERVLVLARPSGRGTTSGLAMVMKSAAVFQIRDAKVMRLVLYSHRDRALADLGLAPEGGSA
jgi:ketosteroid isomerase-like protein